MTVLYKLTDSDGYTRRGEANQCLWGEGVSHSGTGEGPLCSRGWIHAYEHPLLAALLNPIHAAIPDPQLWVCEGEIALRDKELKVGCKTLTTLRRIKLPEIPAAARVAFAIHCAMHIYKEPAFTRWANKWLSGEDRSRESAYAAYAAADAAARAAAAYAAYAAADAAADAAEYAAKAAAEYAAYAAEYAAYAAEYAAYAAAYAAYAAAEYAAYAAEYAADTPILKIALEIAAEYKIKFELGDPLTAMG